MPKRKVKVSPKLQAEQFEREVQKLIDAGELSPTDADAALDALVRRGAKSRSEE